MEKGEVLRSSDLRIGNRTLLRCITNLSTSTAVPSSSAGDTLVDTNGQGEAVYADKQTTMRIRLRVGLVFQNFNLFPHFSVMRNLTEAQVHVLRTPKEQARQVAQELLRKMGLEEKADAYPYQLSGGQQQRVSIARALR